MLSASRCRRTKTPAARCRASNRPRRGNALAASARNVDHERVWEPAVHPRIEPRAGGPRARGASMRASRTRLNGGAATAASAWTIRPAHAYGGLLWSVRGEVRELPRAGIPDAAGYQEGFTRAHRAAADLDGGHSA